MYGRANLDLLAALCEWWRKAELSGDRAGLLAGQDPVAALRLAMKLAGGVDLSEVDTTTFVERAAEYERTGDLRDGLIKVRMVLASMHPFRVAIHGDGHLVTGTLSHGSWSARDGASGNRLPEPPPPTRR